MPDKEVVKIAIPKGYPLHGAQKWVITLENIETGEKVKIPLLWALDEIRATGTPIKGE